MIFRRAFAGTGVKIISFPVGRSRSDAELWWETKKGTRVVLMEYLKIAWYLLSRKSMQTSEETPQG